ncbi:putative transposase [Methylobacter tundripaludum]|uniref:Putative transposase n=1 Tax=Methylobacter tundripaludum TaxID=173365 RepID=A0A2S6HBJ2_9GAMM|nr:DDE-type integrase/transposase/recombinase [Methylobacter tundripaludum]PPK74763.1 putative transposase [Methylobacter tundripaludum]
MINSDERKFQTGIVVRGIGPGSVVDARGHRHIIRRFIDVETVLGYDLDNRQEIFLPIVEIVPLISDAQRATQDLAVFTDKAWKQAVDRSKIVYEFLAIPERTAKIAKSIADKYGISSATLYRWAQKFQKSGTVSGLARLGRKDAGVRRLDGKLEKLVDDIIVKHYLKRETMSIKKCYTRLRGICKRLKLEPPHFNTFKNRVKSIAADVVAERRLGPRAVSRLQPLEGSFDEAHMPLDVIQIDHTLVDIILVDDIHRVPIGRPWITVAIDVYSRMVIGWYISFNSPGTLGTGICISNAVLPKAPLLNQLGVSYNWPCFGKPRIIHLDNAKEFRGNTLAMACQDHGITLQFRKLKKPRYGAHIERLLGTLKDDIHTLPGTTFSNTNQRDDYDSEKNAAMTLSEFELWLANLILGIYHHQVHSGIYMPPLEKYRLGIMGNDERPGIGYLPIVANPEKLQIDFLPLVERTIQPYGVKVDGVSYYSDVLQPWIGTTMDQSVRIKRKFIFRRDPRDISSLLFFDPQLKHYFRIPYRNPTRPAITLWELRAIKKFLLDQGKAAEDEDVIFGALDEMQRIVDNAVNTTKRVQQEQKRLARRGVGISHREDITAEISSSTPISTPSILDIANLRPFDEVEDS